MRAAELVLELKKEHPQIKLEAAVPCESQTRNWPEDQLQRYKAILEQADDVTCVQREHTKEVHS